MTQRIFDIENEKDYADLWDILPDNATSAKRNDDGTTFYDSEGVPLYYTFELIKINWHDKTEITRPIQEANEADIGKICAFWEDGNTSVVFAELVDIAKDECYKYQAGHESNRYEHCRRLTKQEIEELC